MVERAGDAAKLGFPAHPHMLRHACGFALANQRPRHPIAAVFNRNSHYLSIS
jgi:integrase